ncbi:molybdopterin-binding domain-containing protein [Rhodococcus artemisiae]|uniref:Molybdopterin-dependent oxidoreductase n=1 Tax=Rhodococcus artemisiae TaxID=714159 RepID=A0ABU7L968_9NOCA|nr:hypothetical protein [Rhodococcus artemisiae]MEE2057839.1 molybdopterin-dependent oxidoreductase [Rhodococcus artemisiae]
MRHEATGAGMTPAIGIGKSTIGYDDFGKAHLIRSGGDMHLIQAVAKRVLLAEQSSPGTVLENEFLDTHCTGFESDRDHILSLDDQEALDATGLTSDQISSSARRYIESNATIITLCLGITQHKNGVATIAEIMNLLLLRGNIGKPGAGASPIRGHSNVQGDRTMGIWEQMPDEFRNALAAEFQFDPPREHGLDTVNSVNAVERGDVKVMVSMAGNIVAAISDSKRAEYGIAKEDWTVQVTTKLNRSHVVTGRESLILLMHRDSVADVCNTPTSKRIIVRLAPGAEAVHTGRPVAT